jgi:hypothetical protein
MEVAALIIAVVSLAVSFYFASRQAGLQRRMAEIEEARRQDEIRATQRADITAAFEKGVDSRGRTTWRFVLTNIGAAAAREVKLEVAAVERLAPDIAFERFQFPIPRLDPTQKYPFPAAMSSGVAPAVQVDLWWNDDKGNKHKTLMVSTV